MSDDLPRAQGLAPAKETAKNDAVNRLTERIIGCAIEVQDRVFEAQVLTYLRVTGKRIGLLINFNSRLLRDGIKRFILD